MWWRWSMSRRPSVWQYRSTQLAFEVPHALCSVDFNQKSQIHTLTYVVTRLPKRSLWTIPYSNLGNPLTLNPFTAKLFNVNVYPLEIVSRWRDPQLQVSENYSDLTKWRSTIFKYCWLMSHFFFKKVVLNVLIKNKNPNICDTGGERVKLA